MFPFYTVVSIIPLALYAGILAVLNLRKTPQVVSRTTDALWLALGLSGFVFIGPVQMIVPINALVDKHALAWVMILLLYFLNVILFGYLFARPRCTIYNVSEEQVHLLLERAAQELDYRCQWLGSSVSISGLNMQILLESSRSSRCVSVEVLTHHASRRDWERFCRVLQRQAGNIPGHSNPAARVFLALAAFLSASAALFILLFPTEMVDGLILLFFP
ncbi:MAG: hypothetical protein Q4G68_09775 [Planctomycetia bacterium]|nr:hypothetical protein [Planctomycetia bacterium]